MLPPTTLFPLALLSLAAVTDSSSSSFSLLDLQDVRFLLRPSDDFCSGDNALSGLVLVHSAPNNTVLRSAVRETWGSAGGFRSVFLLGSVENDDDDRSLREEHEIHGDIVQGSFKDAYRNMTYKHLLGYRWARDHCPQTDVILKSDDDQAVDTFHLPVFLDKFIPSIRSEEPVILCLLMTEQRPFRNVESKWHVTYEEFSGDLYPPYCAGWAYVTNQRAIAAILESAEEQKEDEENSSSFFWIDDVFVTGMLRPETIKVYNWHMSFLNSHVHYTDEVLHGSMFSPELMVASDLGPNEIRRLFGKFKQCHRDQWVQLVYKDEKMLDIIRPKLFEREGAKRDEL